MKCVIIYKTCNDFIQGEEYHHNTKYGYLFVVTIQQQWMVHNPYYGGR